MTIHNCQFSVIEYRPDPASPRDRIPLAVVMETKLKGRWYLGVVARPSLTEGELGRLDGIGRELLASPSKFIESAVEDVIKRAGKPPPGGEALNFLAQRFNWTLSVSAPEKHAFAPSWIKSAKTAVADELGELFRAYVAGERPARLHVRPDRLPMADVPLIPVPVPEVAFQELCA
jgi:hypothetical protein